jgi:hypothetical protein
LTKTVLARRRRRLGPRDPCQIATSRRLIRRNSRNRRQIPNRRRFGAARLVKAGERPLGNSGVVHFKLGRGLEPSGSRAIELAMR